MKHKYETIFVDAWDEIKSSYKSSCINSERTLQALLHCYLCNKLPSTIVICEPTIELEGADKVIRKVIPDMLVLEGEEVTAVVELKFVPHDYPVFEDDLEKLEVYARLADAGADKIRFRLLLDPDTGQFNDKQFSFSPQCLLVFGVIGRHDAEALAEAPDEDILKTHMAGLMKTHMAGLNFLPLRLPVGK